MGEPATPTPVERAWTRAYAKSVVDAVRNDEEQPLAHWPDDADSGPGVDVMGDDTVIFKLAQEIEMLVKEHDETARKIAEYAAAHIIFPENR